MNLELLAALLKFVANKCSESALEFDTSRSVELTAGEALSGGVTMDGVRIVNRDTGESQWFEFYGAGVGLGVGTPIQEAISTEDFPSSGSRLVEGPFTWNLDFDDLTGLGHIFTISASIIGGSGVAILCFGERFSSPLSAKGFMVTEGVTIGGFGAGVMAYMGHWSKSDS